MTECVGEWGGGGGGGGGGGDADEFHEGSREKIKLLRMLATRISDESTILTPYIPGHSTVLGIVTIPVSYYAMIDSTATLIGCLI